MLATQLCHPGKLWAWSKGNTQHLHSPGLVKQGHLGQSLWHPKVTASQKKMLTLSRATERATGLHGGTAEGRESFHIPWWCKGKSLWEGGIRGKAGGYAQVWGSFSIQRWMALLGKQSRTSICCVTGIILPLLSTHLTRPDRATQPRSWVVLFVHVLTAFLTRLSSVQIKNSWSASSAHQCLVHSY